MIVLLVKNYSVEESCTVQFSKQKQTCLQNFGELSNAVLSEGWANNYTFGVSSSFTKYLILKWRFLKNSLELPL